jgi:hypothetical protein
MARMTIGILQCAVVQGAANHRYRSFRDIDEFTCTDRLIKHWTRLFHEERPTVSEHRFIVRLKGSRSRYFTSGWWDPDRLIRRPFGRMSPIELLGDEARRFGKVTGGHGLEVKSLPKDRLKHELFVYPWGKREDRP